MAALCSLLDLFKVLLFFTLLSLYTQLSTAQVEDTTTTLNLTTDLQEWPTAMSMMYNEDTNVEDLDFESAGRRELLWRTMRHYYISYGALSANRVPCPPRSGRSYYTHNCFKARGPVHPYYRGCSRISRCRR